jgi:hypothetical protein
LVTARHEAAVAGVNSAKKDIEPRRAQKAQMERFMYRISEIIEQRPEKAPKQDQDRATTKAAESDRPYLAALLAEVMAAYPALRRKKPER